MLFMFIVFVCFPCFFCPDTLLLHPFFEPFGRFGTRTVRACFILPETRLAGRRGCPCFFGKIGGGATFVPSFFTASIGASLPVGGFGAPRRRSLERRRPLPELVGITWLGRVGFFDPGGRG